MVEKASRPTRRDMQPLDFAKLEKMKMLDLRLYPYQLSQRLIGKYTRQDIKNYLLAPEIYMNQIQLRYISKYLYNVSSHYRRLVNYFSNILTLDYVVEPYGLDTSIVDVAKFRKAYQKAVSFVDNMNIKHEIQKALSVAFREDVFYGYIHMGKDSFFIQQLNPDYCKVSSHEDGTYNFAFNYNYFRAFPFRLPFFPQEFQDGYEAYCQDGQYWREMDSKNTICIKVNEDLEYPIPPFVGVFANLLDIEDFKDLRKTKTEIDNYKLLVQKIPVRTNSSDNNDYAITLDHATKFHNNIVSNLPEQIGLATTPMDLELINFERDRPDVNRVADAEKEFWNASGVSQLLFTGDSGSIAMNNSIIADEMIAYQVLRQVERSINKILKLNNIATGQYKFRVQMLDITRFNKSDVFNDFVQMGTYGFPVKTRIASSMGMSQSSLTAMQFLESDVLQLHEQMIPMQNSHTQSADDPTASPNGRPKKKAKDLSEEGAKTRDKVKNDNRAK